MPSTARKRISTDVLQADEEALVGLRNIPVYQPANPAFALEVISAVHTRYRAAQDAEIVAQNTLAAARDAAVATQWEFHEAILGAKNQIKALYGEDSDELAALGLKKKSDRKAPHRGSKPDAA